MPSKISDFPIKRKENKNKTTTKQEQKKTVELQNVACSTMPNFLKIPLGNFLKRKHKKHCR